MFRFCYTLKSSHLKHLSALAFHVMEMLTKFESRSSRAKAVAFHPSRPWILVGLYTSTIQLWDYRMGAVIDRFEGHEGPVRGVDVHPTQQMFVSCGDDATVRVWSLSSRRLLFTLSGHFDYVRTAFFHPELPWIVSASDDQTIRIWNWQNRQEIACLTGHNHWVCCAQFHPYEDLIVSGSLDTYVRVWDISGLRKRHSAPGAFGDMGIPPVGGLPLNGPGQDDIFGTDAVCKWVLQGHDRGVTWVEFHPSLPLILSSSDDRSLKVWRMSEARAWELDTCRGHSDDVTGGVFHPTQDLILSCSADKTLRSWDSNRRIQLHSFKRENDKFWNVRFHPSMNLIAAAHDSGVIVFKLERERPPAIVHGNRCFYVVRKEKTIKEYEFGGADRALLSLKKFGSQWQPMRELSYNAAENAIVATTRDERGVGMYVFAKLPENGPVEPSSWFEGTASQALFVTRNRFAVFQPSKQQIELRDMENAVTRTIQLPIETKYVSSGPSGHLLLFGANSVVLFDIQQRKVTGKVNAPGVKYAVWSSDFRYVALQAKHSVVIAQRTAENSLEQLSMIRETIRIKSVGWDETGVLIFTTFNHLKYALLNGDSGVLKTLSQTLYVETVRRNSVFCLSRSGNVHVVKIDPSEYRFKRALVTGQFGEVGRLIRESQLVGQSIVAYLQKRGFPQIAMEFVSDPQTKFDLAVECGDLAVATEQAKTLGPAADSILARVALEQGNHDVLEGVYQRQMALGKLAMLYLVTGNRGRLQRLEQVAEHRGDPALRFQTSLFSGSVEQRVALLHEMGQPALAWALAKSHGLGSRAQELVSEQVTPEATLHDVASKAAVGVTHGTFEFNWPLKPRENALELLNQPVKSSETSEAAPSAQVDSLDIADDDAEEDASGAVEDDNWDLDVEMDEEAADATAEVVDAGKMDQDVRSIWMRGSTLPADHIAAGSFETAAQLLNRQIGVVNFAPLKSRFLDVYRASKLYMTGHDGLPPLEFYVQRSGGKHPFVPGAEALDRMLQEAFAQVKANQLELAVSIFREILYTIATLAVESDPDVEKCKRVIETCRNYILAFSIELQRRKLPPSDTKRNLELASYFTKPKLRPSHATLPLRVALTQAFGAKNYALASHFCSEYLKLDAKGPGATKVRKIKTKCDSQPLDAVDIDFDTFAEFDICPGTLTPIYKGQPTERDPFTHTPYHASQKGQLCAITGITQVGAAVAGLRLSI